MAGKCGKTGGCCTCNVKKKRRATARRPPPAPVYKGQTINIVGGTEQQYVNNLMAQLQNLNRPQVAQTAGIAVPVKPVMISTGVDARPAMISGGTQTAVGTRTGGTQTAIPAMVSTGTDARPNTATIGTATTTMDTRGTGMQTEPQGTGARAVARLFGAIRPAIIAERAANLQEARDVGMAEGYRQGRQRGETIGAVQGAAEAIQGLTFRQAGARGGTTYTVPELQARFAEGQILIPRGGRPAAGGGGGGAVQAVAEAAAPK